MMQQQETIIVASGAYVDSQLEVEFGRIPPAFLPLGGLRLYQHQFDNFSDLHNTRFIISVPDDYVISTGEAHSVREFVQYVFEYAGLGDYRKWVTTDEKYLRPHEVPYLLGDSTKAKKVLGWEPKIKFAQLAKMMYDSDYGLIKNQQRL